MDELAALDAGRVHLDPFEVQVPDRLDGHARLEAGGGAVQRTHTEPRCPRTLAEPRSASDFIFARVEVAPLRPLERIAMFLLTTAPVLARPPSGPRARLALLPLLGVLAACNVFDESLESRVVSAEAGAATASIAPVECRTHAECAGRPNGPSACVKPEGRCVPLKSDVCPTITGDLSSDDAIVLGSLLSVSGAQAMTNLPRQQSVILAIEAINNVGGVPGMGTTKRPLVLVSCDEVADLSRASTHLINELKVPAIVGPNVSQDVITVSNESSVARNAVLFSPTAVASSIAASPTTISPGSWSRRTSSAHRS